MSSEEPWDAARIGRTYGVAPESLDRLGAYGELLKVWNARINLVSARTLEDLWGRHMADSLELARFLPRKTNRLADLGSGAGFPGLVLACACDQQITLYESNGKKAAFLREASRAMGLESTVCTDRIETVGAIVPGSCDAVTARALAPLDRLLDLASPWMRAGAVGLFLKGQDVDAELKEAAHLWDLEYTIHPVYTEASGCVLAVRRATRRT